MPTESYAAFGQATYSLTDQFGVTGGVRYTYERKEMDEQIARYTFQSGTPLRCGAGTVLNPQSLFAPQVCRLQLGKGNAGLAVADFWRLCDNKIVEHWDVIQEVPKTTVSGNSMF